MGLAVGQVQLLALTRRKADIEGDIAILSMRKMNMARQMTQLTQQYNAELNSRKNVVYYANGKYNKVDYTYLMGPGGTCAYVQLLSGNVPIKKNNKMILADYNGRVVLSQTYANAIKAVLGSGIIDSNGRGSTFSLNDVPKILAELCPPYTESELMDGISEYTYNATVENPLTQTTTGTTTQNGTESINNEIQKIVAYYYPIISAAASNGWTTEHNTNIAENEDYISDGIQSGILNVVGVDDSGMYVEGTSVTYYALAGDLDTRSDTDTRAKVTQKYDKLKEDISYEESWLDLELKDLSTEYESIKAEMESIKSLINDAVQSVFGWGSGGG